MKDIKRQLYSKSTGLWRMVVRASLTGIITFVISTAGGRSQGTLVINFDGPPELSAGTGQITETYSESGMQFRRVGPFGPSAGVRRSASGYFAWPDNGSTFLVGVQGTTNSLGFSSLNGASFNLLSVDMAEYVFSTDPTTVQFAGYRHDGSIVTTAFTTDGINDRTGPLTDFQTFWFGSEFTELDRVEIPSHGWSLDNLVVFIPEPSALALFLLSASFLGWRWHRARRR